MPTYIVEFLNEQDEWIPYQKFHDIGAVSYFVRTFDGVFRVMLQTTAIEEIDIR